MFVLECRDGDEPRPLPWTVHFAVGGHRGSGHFVHAACGRDLPEKDWHEYAFAEDVYGAFAAGVVQVSCRACMRTRAYRQAVGND